MAWKIQIYRCKPNPAGKDKNDGSPIAEKLVKEWVDLKNTGDTSVFFSTLNLANTTFTDACSVTNPTRIYWVGGGTNALEPGKILRVHTGKSINSGLLALEDQMMADYHAYAESGNFILNNKCGDKLSVLWKSSDGKWNTEDSAKYAPNPTEGKILTRSGDSLV